MTLTSNQVIAIKLLLPQVRKFLSPKYSDKFLQQALEEAFKSGNVGGIVKIEKFNLGDVEGIRVQEGNYHEYFRIEKR